MLLTSQLKSFTKNFEWFYLYRSYLFLKLVCKSNFQIFHRLNKFLSIVTSGKIYSYLSLYSFKFSYTLALTLKKTSSFS